MKRVNNKVFSFQLGIGLIIVWCAVILLLGNINRLGPGGWAAYFFVPVCIAIACLKGISVTAPENDSSFIGVSVYYSLAFVILAIVINGIYIFMGKASLTRAFIAADIILLAIYLMYFLFVFLYQKNLADKVLRVRTNTEFSADISKKIGKMLAETTDRDIHKAMVRLKESIDYSSNSTGIGVDESVIRATVNNLQKLMDEKADKQEIERAISDVERAWKARNARL